MSRTGAGLISSDDSLSPAAIPAAAVNEFGNFLYPGSGAVAYPLLTRLCMFTSPLDFGGLADGATGNAVTNSAAVQAACDVFAGAPGMVIIPPNYKWNYTLISHPNEVQILDYSGYDWVYDQWGGQAVKALNSTVDPSTKNAHQWVYGAPYHPAMIMDNTGALSVFPQASVSLAQNGAVKWMIGKGITSVGGVADQDLFIAGGIYNQLRDAVVVNGDQTVTSASGTWSAAYVGKPIILTGAGPAGATLTTTIASVTSPTEIELTDAPSTSVNPATLIYGGIQTTTFTTGLVDGLLGFNAHPTVGVSEQHTSRYAGSAIFRWKSSGTTYNVAHQFYAGADAKCSLLVLAATGDLTFNDASGNLQGRLDQTGELYGFKSKIIAVPNSVAMTHSTSVSTVGATFCNTGQAGGTTNIQELPDAVAGLRYSFCVTAAETFRVDPNTTPGTDLFRGKAAGKYKQSNTLGSTLTIQCVVNGTWEVLLESGTWVDE